MIIAGWRTPMFLECKLLAFKVHFVKFYHKAPIIGSNALIGLKDLALCFRELARLVSGHAHSEKITKHIILIIH